MPTGGGGKRYERGRGGQLWVATQDLIEGGWDNEAPCCNTSAPPPGAHILHAAHPKSKDLSEQ